MYEQLELDIDGNCPAPLDLPLEVKFPNSETNIPPQIEETGSSVNLEERAILLTFAINAMARRNQLTGFSEGFADDRYSKGIYERYNGDTLKIIRASERKVDHLLNEAKRAFWHASGFPELRLNKQMEESLLQSQAQEMWQEFRERYDSPYQQKQRDGTRKQLSRFIPKARIAETKIK